MPYTSEHKENTRKRIVESARRLFNRHGFTGVSIDEIMADAGLTRGGFYNHFATKEELYAEVVAAVLSCKVPDWSESAGAQQTTVARRFITAYLSQAHLEDRDGSCPLMALPSDVARGGEPVKRAYRQVLEYMLGNLEQGLQGPHARQRALAVAALCIGGMAVARAVDDPDFADEMREAARAMALSATGTAELPAAAE